jgi:flagellar motor component MotA
MKRFSIIPWLVALALVQATILVEGGSPAWFISLSALTCCYGISLCLLLTQYTPADLLRAFRAVSMQRASSRSELLVVKSCFETLQALLMSSGFMGVLLGFVAVLGRLGTGQMGSSDTAGTAEGLAVCLMSLLYAASGVLFVSAPCIGAAKKKLALLEED